MAHSPQSFKSTTVRNVNGTKQQRGYGGEWERISKIYRQAHPVCEVCNDAPADHVDHIVPFKGLRDPNRTAISNLQSICAACHSKKTRSQS